MKKITSVRACPSCGEKKGGVDVLYHLNMTIDLQIPLPDNYDIVCCDNCGCCYADTTATYEDYNKYYSAYNYYSGTPSMPSHEEFGEMLASVLSRVFAVHADKNDLIVDIGFGAGEMLKSLQLQGYRVAGIDPSQESVCKLKESGIPAYVGNIYYPMDEPLPEKARFVMVNGVLEHLYDPFAAFHNVIQEYLATSGFLIITYPMFDDLLLEDAPIPNEFNHEHINYFSRATADLLFSRLGMQCVGSHHTFEYYRQKAGVQFIEVSIYQRINTPLMLTRSVVKDFLTKRSIEEYISRQIKIEKQYGNIIDELHLEQIPLAIWGTGSFLMRLMSTTNLKECNIRMYIDNNKSKWNLHLFNRIVLPPDSLNTFDGAVLIASMLNTDIIVAQIRSINEGLRVITLQ